MKIVILDGHAVNPGDLNWDFLHKYGEVTVYERTPVEEVAKRIGDADIVLTNKSPINEEILKVCPNIKLVCVLATGYNVVDCEATKKRGIPVCNVPDYGTAAVAQFTFAMLLDLCHKVAYHAQTVRDGKWCACPDFCYWDTPQMELAGKTMGIIGYGSIGQAVGEVAQALGMKLLVHSRHTRPELESETCTYTDMEMLLSQSDVVSLHCPQTEQTTGMINKDTIAMMKDGAILLNTSRGGLVVEQDLADALRSGKLRGAAVDVVSREPIDPNNPLLTAPNLLMTPHIAWAPLEARQRLLTIAEENLQAYANGQPINVVNA